MRLRWLAPLGGLLATCLAGCPASPAGSERNPFVTLTEQFGTFSGPEEDTGAGAGVGAEGEFRRTMTVSFSNNHTTAMVDTSFAAWVNVSSIRTAQQQDALLTGGFVQLTREVSLGTAFTLPPGTFVYNGPGMAGATSVRLASPETGGAVLATDEITLITPDVLLVFSQPPVSCDSVAFTFIGEIGTATTGAVTSEGGYKTLAQIDVYQCEPLNPGLFLRIGGGAKQANEFFEGENVLFEFNEGADANGNFANVTVFP